MTTGNFHEGLNTVETLEKFIQEDGDLRMTSTFTEGGEKVSLKGGQLIRGVASRNNPNEPVPSALIQFNPSLPTLQIQLGNFGGVGGVAGNYAQLFKPRIYRFNAQRRPGFQCGAH